MGRIGDRMADRRRRRQERRSAKKPQQQFYGGSKKASSELRDRNRAGVAGGQTQEERGLDQLDTERRQAGADLRGISAQTQGERERAGERYGEQLGNVQGEQRRQAQNALTYGTGADAALGDYGAGRGAILGGAGELEALARSAPGKYQSAADAAFNAAAERNQRQALSLAAGRGNDAIRTALATADAGNRAAQLEQQATRAQEMNQLLALQSGALESAAGIRSGVGAQDQAAAQLQAQRQQAATGAGTQLAGLGADIVGADVGAGLNAGAQRAALAGTEAEIAANAAAARAGAGAGARGAYLGAEGAQEGAQLGSNLGFEQQRQQVAQQKGFTGFMNKLAGGLTNIKGVADAGDFGPGVKLLGKTQTQPATY